MKNIIAFAGSNSKNSINKQLVTYTTSLINNVNITILDLNDFDLPLFGVDLEAQIGHPENAKKFLKHIQSADGVILSLAEHNGAYTAVFKNLLDWMSRIDVKIFAGKPVLLMATSNGARGGLSVFTMAKERLPKHHANIVASFTLPKFNEHFSNGMIIDDSLNTELQTAVEAFKTSL